MDSHPCHDETCPGTCGYVDDDFGSLTGGGSYEVWRCDTCRKTVRTPLPD